MQLRECVNDLKSKLYAEVNNYEQLKMKLNNQKLKKDMLIEIIINLGNETPEELKENLLQINLLLPLVYGEFEGERIYNLLLSSVYSKKIIIGNESETNKKKFNLVKKEILDNYQVLCTEIELLENQIKNDQNKIIEYRRILSNYKYSGLITPKQIELITKMMQQYNYDKKDQIRVLESIRTHNIKVRYTDYKISNTVTNMLDANYEKYTIDQLDDFYYKDKFQTTISSFIKSIENTESIEESIMLMPELESQSYTFEEFDYIYKSIINYLIDKLLEDINLITDQSIYNDIDLRRVVIQEYNEYNYKYRKINNHYNEKRNEYCKEVEQQKELVNSSKEIVNNIFYQITPNGDMSYLEKDIKDFPEEYLLKVKKLIENKKYDTLSPDMDSPLTSHKQLRKYRELRDDQVRIMYKHLSQNNFLIVGAFVKKTDSDLLKYGTIASRNNELNISTAELFTKEMENSTKIEDRIYSYIEENARKGSR